MTTEEDDGLDSNVSIQGKSLKSVTGQDPDEIEVLGYAVMYTVGADWKVIVPRDWLLTRCEQLGIPNRYWPSEPRSAYVYKRAMKRLSDVGLDSETVRIPRLDNGIEDEHDVELSLKKGDSVNVRHLYADVFYDEKESGEAEGDWQDVHLGYYDYDPEVERMLAFADSDLERESPFAKLWSRYTSKVREYNRELHEVHIGLDIRKMMYSATEYRHNNVVSLRDGGGVYFFSAELTDFVDSMSKLYHEINEKYKTGGSTMAVRTLPVLDSDTEREWIEERVRKELEESVDRLIDETYKKHVDGKAHSEVLSLVRENLSEFQQTAEVYNALLETELDIERMYKEHSESLTDSDKKDLVESVMKQEIVSD